MSRVGWRFCNWVVNQEFNSLVMTALLSDYLQQQRLATVLPFVRGDILDLGCGTAPLTAYLAVHQTYTGVEGDFRFVQWLQTHRAPHSFYQRDLDSADLDLPQTFDTIVMTAVVEHLSRPERLFQQLPSYLKARGQVLITTPSPLGHRIHALGARVGLFSQAAAEDHKTIFTLATLEVSLSASGLTVTHQRLFLLGGNQLCVSVVRRGTP